MRNAYKILVERRHAGDSRMVLKCVLEGIGPAEDRTFRLFESGEFPELAIDQMPTFQ